MPQLRGPVTNPATIVALINKEKLGSVGSIYSDRYIV